MGKILNWFKAAVQPCVTCSGTGVLPDGLDRDDRVSCLACDGLGVLDKEERISYTKETPCDNPLCHNGKVSKETLTDGEPQEMEVDCPVCDGLTRTVRQIEEKYTAHRTCPVCKGKGMITAQRLHEKHLEYFCPNCKGLGKSLNLKRFILTVPLIGFIVAAPLLAFVVFAFGGVVFSLYAIRANKNKQTPDPLTLYSQES